MKFEKYNRTEYEILSDLHFTVYPVLIEKKSTGEERNRSKGEIVGHDVWR